jgi:predicted NBD/HSP70 family sugar kinase
MALPEKLVRVQELLAKGDERARRIYQTIGAYFGYGVAGYADFYDVRHVLVLGRVMTGEGGDAIVAEAERVLREEFPELAGRIRLHVPGEMEKRHGQAMAAASLPAIPELRKRGQENSDAVS